MMSLAELFHALNLAGVGIVAAGGKLQLRPAGAVTLTLRDAVAGHKSILLALLPQAAAAQPGKSERQADYHTAEPSAMRAPPIGEAMAPEPWDDAARALVVGAVDRWTRSPRAADAEAVRQRQAAGARMDAAIDAHDLADLRREVEEFAKLLGVAPAHQLSPVAQGFPGVPDEATYEFTDSAGWRWFRIPGASAREDSFSFPDWKDCIPVDSGPKDGGAVPPIGSTFYYSDEDGRPCSAAVSHMWTWAGAASWQYTRERPPPDNGNNDT
jgi:hypothetical protein